MPVTSRAVFPDSSTAAKAVAATHERQKAAFDKCLEEMEVAAAGIFQHALTGAAGQITHHASEKRFEVSVRMPFMNLLHTQVDVNHPTTYSKAQAAFAGDGERLQAQLREALQRSVSGALLAKEYDRIQVKVFSQEEVLHRSEKGPHMGMRHYLDVSVSFPDS